MEKFSSTTLFLILKRQCDGLNPADIRQLSAFIMGTLFALYHDAIGGTGSQQDINTSIALFSDSMENALRDLFEDTDEGYQE